MIDRVSVAGMSGTAATFGLSTLDSFLGIAVGAVTLVYMSDQTLPRDPQEVDEQIPTVTAN